MVGPFGIAAAAGVGAPLGVTGTSGTVLNPGAGAVAVTGGEAVAGVGGEGCGKGGAGGDEDVVGG